MKKRKLDLDEEVKKLFPPDIWNVILEELGEEAIIRKLSEASKGMRNIVLHLYKFLVEKDFPTQYILWRDPERPSMLRKESRNFIDSITKVENRRREETYWKRLYEYLTRFPQGNWNSASTELYAGMGQPYIDRLGDVDSMKFSPDGTLLCIHIKVEEGDDWVDVWKWPNDHDTPLQLKARFFLPQIDRFEWSQDSKKLAISKTDGRLLFVINFDLRPVNTPKDLDLSSEIGYKPWGSIQGVKRTARGGYILSTGASTFTWLNGDDIAVQYDEIVILFNVYEFAISSGEKSVIRSFDLEPIVPFISGIGKRPGALEIVFISFNQVRNHLVFLLKLFSENYKYYFIATFNLKGNLVRFFKAAHGSIDHTRFVDVHQLDDATFHVKTATGEYFTITHANLFSDAVGKIEIMNPRDVKTFSPNHQIMYTFNSQSVVRVARFSQTSEYVIYTQFVLDDVSNARAYIISSRGSEEVVFFDKTTGLFQGIAPAHRNELVSNQVVCEHCEFNEAAYKDNDVKRMFCSQSCQEHFYKKEGLL